MLITGSIAVRRMRRYFAFQVLTVFVLLIEDGTRAWMEYNYSLCLKVHIF